VPDQVAFPALIKELSVKSLVSGDKEARLVLQFLPTDDILDGINRLHRADASVMVGLVPISENTGFNSHEIPKRPKRKPQG
jgi:hypothetical protein